MAEFLFAVNPDDVPEGTSVGEPVDIRPDGYGWGSGELDPLKFRIVEVSQITMQDARAVYYRDGVPLSERQKEARAQAGLTAAADAYAAALSEEPQDPVKVATTLAARDAAQAAFDAAEVVVEDWPVRRYHIDLSVLGPGKTKTLSELTQASKRRALQLFKNSVRHGDRRGVALAAAITAATPVRDLDAAKTED
jgi:hypothetical protein